MENINQKNWDYFRKSCEQGKLSHAYLFCGPEGTGKFEFAIDVVRLANQLKMTRDKLISGCHPDVFIIRPEGQEKKIKPEAAEHMAGRQNSGKPMPGKRKVKNITIEQVKNVTEKIGLYAYQARYKFLVIDKADKMTVAASNSLLKLIEEPPTDTIIILVAFSEESVLPTIRSRCQRIRFGLQSQESLAQFLSRKYSEAGPERLSQVAEYARGRVQLALQYLDHEDQLVRVQETVEEFRQALRMGVGRGFALAEKLAQDKQQLLDSLEEWVWYLSRFQLKLLQDQADLRIQRKTHGILKELLSVRETLAGSNANERLQLEKFFVRIN